MSNFVLTSHTKKERPCSNCGLTPLNHTIVHMLCPGFASQYNPDPDKEGTIPSTLPKPYKFPVTLDTNLL